MTKTYSPRRRNTVSQGEQSSTGSYGAPNRSAQKDRKPKSFHKSSKPFHGRGRNSGGGRSKGRQDFRMQLDHFLKSMEKQEAPRPFKAAHAFDDMGLDKGLMRNLQDAGFVAPTEIQEVAIPAVMDGRDVMGIAQTGTGKTGAFLIPLIQKWLDENDQMRLLVVVPTRELAQQVYSALLDLSRGLGMKSACFVGGKSIDKDFKSLRRNPDVVIGTPGRLVDLHKRRKLQLASTTHLVLDEFDRMLDMGFSEDLASITDAMINRKQTMLFSATFQKALQAQIDRLLHNPVEIKVSSGHRPGQNISQEIISVDSKAHKLDKLKELLDLPDFQKVLLFAETKRDVDFLAQTLRQAGVRSDLIHGDKSQKAREFALQKFRNGRVKVLVATDVAARGIDIDDISHVINYSIPQTFDTYVHRIGRTGRAGKSGKAITLVS